jgi:conjugal transfer/entry exclusion protein
MAKKKAAKKAVSTKKTGSKKAGKAAPDATPAADPCAAWHQWDADADGEFCTICRADKKVVEKAENKKVSKASKPKMAKPAKAEGKLSALDAAAQVLASSSEPLNTKQMIEQMAAKGLWTSPGGATPHAAQRSCARSREGSPV